MSKTVLALSRPSLFLRGDTHHFLKPWTLQVAWFRTFCDMNKPVSNLLQHLYLVINFDCFCFEHVAINGCTMIGQQKCSNLR